jgi:hypothetical protein
MAIPLVCLQPYAPAVPATASQGYPHGLFYGLRSQKTIAIRASIRQRMFVCEAWPVKQRDASIDKGCFNRCHRAPDVQMQCHLPRLRCGAQLFRTAAWIKKPWLTRPCIHLSPPTACRESHRNNGFSP